MREKECFIIIPTGENCVGWKGVHKILRIMGKPEKTQTLGLGFPVSAVESDAYPHTVRTPDKERWNNILVCDVWGVTAPWKIVGSTVTRFFSQRR